jgi:hypothetical protein
MQHQVGERISKLNSSSQEPLIYILFTFALVASPIIIVLMIICSKAQRYGPINPAMHCPHCEKRGAIRTKRVKRAKGISGGKATAALLTGGASMLLTGLSRRERSTQVYCGNCRNLWHF